MVLLGGLEIVAAGYLLNEFNKDKVEARERRKHSSRPHSPDRRPSRRDDRYDEHRPSRPSGNFLAPPNHGPPRPSSAPPVPPQGLPQSHTWPMAPPSQYSGPPPPYPGPSRTGPAPPQNSPFPAQTFPMNNNNSSSPPPPPLQQMQSFPPPNFQQGPRPGLMGPNQPPPLQRPNSFQPQMPPNQGPPPSQYHSGPASPPPPGYHLNHPTTGSFMQPPPNHQPQQQNRPPSHSFSGPGGPNPGLQPSNTFPQTMATGRPPIPTSQSQPHNIHAHIPPGTYIDMKTGRVQHNLYPPDHPMARSIDVGGGGGGAMDDTDLELLNHEHHQIRDDMWGNERDRARDRTDNAVWRGRNMENVRDERGTWVRERRRDSSEDLAYGKASYGRDGRRRDW